MIELVLEFTDGSGKAIIDTLNSYSKSPWQRVYRCIIDDRMTIERDFNRFNR